METDGVQEVESRRAVMYRVKAPKEVPGVGKPMHSVHEELAHHQGQHQGPQ